MSYYEDAIRIEKVTGGYIVSSATQAPDDRQVFTTVEEVFEYLLNRFKEKLK